VYADRDSQEQPVLREVLSSDAARSAPLRPMWRRDGQASGTSRRRVGYPAPIDPVGLM
jgi:hypothetical protein